MIGWLGLMKKNLSGSPGPLRSSMLNTNVHNFIWALSLPSERASWAHVADKRNSDQFSFYSFCMGEENVRKDKSINNQHITFVEYHCDVLILYDLINYFSILLYISHIFHRDIWHPHALFVYIILQARTGPKQRTSIYPVNLIFLRYALNNIDEKINGRLNYKYILFLFKAKHIL